MLAKDLPYYHYDGWSFSSPCKARLKHGFFTTVGGVSDGVYKSLNCGYGSNDNPAFVSENRRRVATGLDCPRKIIWAKTISLGSHFVVKNARSARDQRPNADAYVTTRRMLHLLF